MSCQGGNPIAVWQNIFAGNKAGDGAVQESCYPYSIPTCPCNHHSPTSPLPNCPKEGTIATPTCDFTKKFACEDKGIFKAESAFLIPASNMEQELVENGPITVAYTVYDDFLTYKSGVYTKGASAKALGGHSVKIVGYGVQNGVKYWTVANSWNSQWGNGGFFKIRRGTNECNIESDAVVAGLPAKPPVTRQDTPSFEQWAASHGKTYASPEEAAFRRAVFNKVVARVHRASASAGFEQGLQWSGLDRTVAELANLRGYGGAQSTSLARQQPFKNVGQRLTTLPKSFDWRSRNAVSPVKQQGQGSSCWSFSSVGAIEGAVAIAGNKSAESLSNQQIMDCSGIDCLDAINGTMTKAFENILEWGGTLDTDKAYPYRDNNCVTWDARCNPSMIDPRCKFWCPPHKCQANHTAAAKISSYTHTKIGNETDLLLALSHGPVAVAIDASQPDFMSYQRGVYSNAACMSDKADLDHAVLAVGWGVAADATEYWVVKNSWGTTWGMDGYFHLARNAKNMCGIATDASQPNV